MAIVVSVQIQLREALSAEEARRLAEETAPKGNTDGGFGRYAMWRGGQS